MKDLEDNDTLSYTLARPSPDLVKQHPKLPGHRPASRISMAKLAAGCLSAAMPVLEVGTQVQLMLAGAHESTGSLLNTRGL